MVVSFKKLLIIVFSIICILVLNFCILTCLSIANLFITKENFSIIKSSLISSNNSLIKQIYINKSRLFYDRKNNIWHCSLLKGKNGQFAVFAMLSNTHYTC